MLLTLVATCVAYLVSATCYGPFVRLMSHLMMFLWKWGYPLLRFLRCVCWFHGLLGLWLWRWCLQTMPVRDPYAVHNRSTHTGMKPRQMKLAFQRMTSSIFQFVYSSSNHEIDWGNITHHLLGGPVVACRERERAREGERGRGRGRGQQVGQISCS